jgi:hypothetical protein
VCTSRTGNGGLAARIARMTGAIFMKLGRAPTMQSMGAPASGEGIDYSGISAVAAAGSPSAMVERIRNELASEFL